MEMKITIRGVIITIIFMLKCIGKGFGEQEQMNSTIDYDWSATCLSDKVMIYWKKYINNLTFEVIGQTTGWIGVGFLEGGSTKEADIVVGWVKGEDVLVMDRKYTTVGFPRRNLQQNITVIEGLESNGLTMFKFSKPRSSINARRSWYEDPLICVYGDVDPKIKSIGEVDYQGKIFRDVTCESREFLCQDSSKCIPFQSFCDGYDHCRDFSDEIINKSQEFGRICDGNDLFNLNKRCSLPERYVCDGRAQCIDGTDECMCGEENKTGYLDNECFRCLRSPQVVIKASQVCDNIIDCPDATDECICTKRKTLPPVCSVMKIDTEEDVSQHFMCKVKNASTNQELNTGKICDNVRDCENGTDEQNCKKIDCPEISNVGENLSENDKCGYKCPGSPWKQATRCDGNFECLLAFEEECRKDDKGCNNPPKICDILKQQYHFLRCPNRGNEILGYQICDGHAHCSDGFDELECSNRFYCGNTSKTIHIDPKKVCNQKKDCDDGSDEYNCSFNCNDSENSTYIDIKQLCDGTFDCDKGKDECQSQCITSVFSSVQLLIASRPLLGYIWILSLVAFFGNLSVAGLSVRDFCRCQRNEPAVKKLNKILVFNLSISDLLVGIYLISIGIENAKHEGNYCFADRDWRSGTTCKVSGTILLIGCEQSVFTMTIITGLRLYTIVRPHRPVNTLLIYMLIALSWIVSVSLAIIPLLPQTQDYFVESIWYQDNPLFSTINHEDVKNYTKWLLLTDKYVNESAGFGYIGSWSLLEHLIGKLNKKYTVHGRFGYYSKHGVCIPPLFPDPDNDASWIYTFMILLINFCAFLFIFAGYVAMYCITTKSRRKIQKKPNKKIQRKITRIIVTDFFFWIPIGIMGMLQVAGTDIPKDVYVIVGLILIPNNSVINLLLHSDIPERIMTKTEPVRAWICSHFAILRKTVSDCCRRPHEEETLVENIEMRVVEEVGN